MPFCSYSTEAMVVNIGCEYGTGRTCPKMKLANTPWKWKIAACMLGIGKLFGKSKAPGWFFLGVDPYLGDRVKAFPDIFIVRLYGYCALLPHLSLVIKANYGIFSLLSRISWGMDKLRLIWANERENLSWNFVERSSALNRESWQVSLMIWMAKISSFIQRWNGVSDDRAEPFDQLTHSVLYL